MALSPEEIEGREFGLSRRGYDRDEVDDFLAQVADQVRRADTAAEAEDEAAVAGRGADKGEAAHPMRARLQGGPADTDDFGRVGAEVAAVLRTADEGAARRRAEAEAEATRIHQEAETEATRIRDEADGYAHRLRAETEAEAERVRADAEVEAGNARTALAEATEQARATIQEAEDRAAALAREAEENAGVRRQELLAEAEHQADQAASLERDVHGRLLSARGDLDQAVSRLDPEATAAAAASTIERASALDPSATPEDGPESLLGQGPPTPPVPPPPPAEPDAATDTTTGLPDVPADDTIPPVPPPPPPPDDHPGAATVSTLDLPYADEDTEVGAEATDESAAEGGLGDLPYAADDTDEAGDEDVIDLRDSEAGDDDDDEDEDEDEDGDPLASMVRDAVGKAVKGATRRRPGGGD